jgi:hypothetical protein
MLINESTIVMSREHRRDLQCEAERARPIQSAGLRSSSAWGLSLPLVEVRQGRLNVWVGLKSLLRPAKQIAQFSQVK